MDMRVNDGWRAYVEHIPVHDRYAVHLANGEHVLKPVDLVMTPVDPMIATDPAFLLDEGASRALYEALGRALGYHAYDPKEVKEALQVERKRVDKFIDYMVNPL